MVLRHATERDLPRIVEIYNATIPTRQSTADISPVSVESRRDWFNRRTWERPILVHEIDGSVVAWVSFENFHAKPAYQRTCELSLYITAEERGKGLGTALLEEALALAPRLGIRSVVAYVFAHNTPSVRLLEKLGFEQWGLLPDVAEMDGSEYSLMIMGKRTDAEDSAD